MPRKTPWTAWYWNDWNSDTFYLSHTQYSIYHRLLNHYYRTGKPLVPNASALQRICYAFGSGDLEDLQLVLAQFFVLEHDGYHNKRADEEIEKCSKLHKTRILVGRKGGLAKARNLLEQKATHTHTHIKDIYTGGGNTNHSGSNGKTKALPPPLNYSQTDFDERDLRKLGKAEKELSQKIKARIGGDPISEQEFFTAACELAGISVERGLKLKEIQRKWPEEKLVH